MMNRIINFLRSRRFLSVLASLAVIAAVSMAFFAPDAWEGNVLNQHDILQGKANSAEVVAHKAETGETSWWTNSLFSGMPTYQIAPSYPSGALFGWLDAVYGLGLPTPANYPAMMMIGMLILLLALKVKPSLALIGAVAWGFSSYFVIIIGAGHLWKFITLAYVPPTIAGLVLIYGGRRLLGAAVAALFMMLQIAGNHVQMSYYFAFVMAGLVVAYGVEAVRSRRLGRWGVNTAILAGAMLLAVVANAPGLWHTYSYSKHTMRGMHSELSSPTGENATSGLDRDYITGYSYGKAETFSLLIPDIQGGASAKPVDGQVAGLTLADTDEGQALMRQGGEMTLLQLFSQYFGGPEGTNGPVYVGAIIVALFIFGAIVVRGPVKWALVVLTLFSIFLAWGRNMQWLTDLFIDYVPMYSKFRAVESILVIAEFCMPLLAVLGLREFFSAANRKTMVKPLAVSFGVCAFFCLIAVVAPSAFGSAALCERDLQTVRQYVAYGVLPADFSIQQYPSVLSAVESMRLAMVKADALRSLMFLAVGALALWFFASGKLKQTWAVAIVGVAVLVDLYTVDKRYLDHDSFTRPAATPFVASTADKAILSDSDPNFRVLDTQRFYSAEPSFFHKSVGGYHAAKLTRYQDMIDRHLAYVARPEVAQLLALRNDSAQMSQFSPEELLRPLSDLHVLDMLNTRYVITDPNAAPVINDGALGNAWFVDSLRYVDGADAEMDALDYIDPARVAVADRRFAPILGFPAPADSADRIALTHYAPDCLKYRASSARGALAVFSEIYYPDGWNAYVDGNPAPIGRVDYLLRAVAIPAGTHSVEFVFKPASVRQTSVLASCSVIVIYLLLLAGLFVRPKKS